MLCQASTEQGEGASTEQGEGAISASTCIAIREQLCRCLQCYAATVTGRASWCTCWTPMTNGGEYKGHACACQVHLPQLSGQEGDSHDSHSPVQPMSNHTAVDMR